MNKQRFRLRCYELLHVPVGTGGKLINAFLTFLIILSVSAIPLHLIPEFEWFEPYLFGFEWFVVIIFTVEYILRAWSASRPVRYMFSWSGAIDLLAIVPFYLMLYGVTDVPYYFLLLRLLRVLKLGKIYSFDRELGAKLIEDQHGGFKALSREKVEYVIQKHPLFFFLSLFPLFLFVSIGLVVLVGFHASLFALLFSGICFLFSLVYFLKVWLDFQYDVIYVTNHRLIIQNRQLFGSRLNDIVYEAITNVKPEDISFMSYVFGYGNIHVQTAAQDGGKHFSNVSKPHIAAEFIYKNRQRILEKDNADQGNDRTENLPDSAESKK